MSETQGTKSDQELVEEFSSLIDSITQEVTAKVMNDTAIKEIQDLDTSIGQLKKKSPELLKNIQTAETTLQTTTQNTQKALQDASSQAQKVLGSLSQQINSQNKTLEKHLQAAAKKYDELSTGSYDMYRKAMDKQTTSITSTIIETFKDEENKNTRQINATVHETNQAIQDAVLREVAKQSTTIQSIQNQKMASMQQKMEETEHRLNKKIEALTTQINTMNEIRLAEADKVSGRTAWILFFNITMMICMVGAFYWRFIK